MSNHFKSNMYVTIFDGAKKSYELKLSDFDKEIICFGRQSDCDIILSSEYASRMHGCIYMENDKCIVEDMKSTNGIYCSGKRVKKASLKDGSYIRIVGSNHDMEQGVLIVFSQKAEDVSWKTVSLENKQEFYIGRDSNNDICLNHVSVSHRHAIIKRYGSDYYIKDNNSTNGVLVNGVRISGKHKLEDKDIILITNSKLIYSMGKITYTFARTGISVIAKNIVKRVGKKKELTICNDVSISINPGELVAIVGCSGAGKTTLMNCISGYSVPTSGNVFVNDIDLYENFDALKNIIGYVPQQDIVYDNLTVEDMLKYSARLRLPNDVDDRELEQIVSHVIDTVELTQRRTALVKSLSGGQKKRASIAVELLTDPNLFFLDEPASGLDPGTEYSLIRTLKGMTVSGKTVILVTHSTLGIGDYDKIIFMGEGGRLCFCGTFAEAAKFFHTEDIVNIYEMIGHHADFWHKRYMEYTNSRVNSGYKNKQTEIKSTSKKGVVRQFCVLCSRYIRLLLNDRQRMLLLMLQAPLLAFLISIVADGKEFKQYEMTKSLLFALSCSAFWIGILSSIQEICKERNILKREYMTGLNLCSYIMSKVAVLGLLCLTQTLLIVSTFAVLVGLPGKGKLINPYFEVFITTLLTSMAAAAIGIFVSALFTNADRAMTVAPILLMPQILFSGLIFNLKNAAEAISFFAVCRWSMEGYGTTANLNSLELKMQETGFLIEHEVESFFKYTNAHMLRSWGILLMFILVFSVGAGVVLRNIKRDR